MTQNLSFRDVEKLSAYLDGQLKPSEMASIETRLQTDPQLASAFKELREARSLLRQLPQRRAPRNFTLTPKMIGVKPPMPRTYPVFRLASVLATLLLFFTFATNFIAPRMTPVPYGIGGFGGGGGGGCGDETPCPEPELAMDSVPEEQAQVESAAPVAEPALEAPLAPGEPAVPTPLITTEGESIVDEGTRADPTMQPNAFEKSAPAESYAQENEPQPEVISQEKPAPPISANFQLTLAGIAILTAIIALILRFLTIRKWRTKTK